jgi:hypothetical protein
VFLTFYGGVLPAIAGQALGPFDDVVVRAAHIVGGPLGAERVIAFRGSDGRWLDAEGTTDTPHAPQSHLRLHSPAHDLMVRFFAEDKDDTPETHAERGPYFAVSIGPWDLRGDGELIADRISPNAPWLAAHTSGSQRQALAGAVVAVRTGSVAHPVVAVRSAPVAPVEVSAPVTASTAKPVASPTPSFGPAFKFVERARIEPKIYRARGTAAERDP